MKFFHLSDLHIGLRLFNRDLREDQEFILKQIVDLAESGKSVIVISSELPEVIGLCDRVYVMYEGRITGQLDREELDQESIMHYAMGGN